MRTISLTVAYRLAKVAPEAVVILDGSLIVTVKVGLVMLILGSRTSLIVPSAMTVAV